METNKEVLTEYGFEKIEAEVYSALVKNGDTSIAKLMEKTELSRASIYDALEKLEEKNLINHRKEGRRAFYSPKHPDKLYEFIEDKKRETEMLNSQMETVIGQFKGAFNLAENKPGIRFFEGKEGAREAINDTLNAQEICAITNPKGVKKVGADINKEHVTKRIKKEINKKILMTDPSAVEFTPKNYYDFTEIKKLPSKINPFNATTQLYDNKVAYFKLRESNIISVIIEDKDFYDVLKNIFDFLWGLSENNTNQNKKHIRQQMQDDIS